MRGVGSVSRGRSIDGGGEQSSHSSSVVQGIFGSMRGAGSVSHGRSIDGGGEQSSHSSSTV
ncbi:MAG: hypothetical protein PHX02_07110, partial [Oscillospiraceae bacterium]|nr:hypothetical protein [Oscillospiraceae bacterium]